MNSSNKNNNLKKDYFITGNVENSVDARVYNEVMRHYAKESISLVNKGNMSVTVAPQNEIDRAIFTENEIYPFHANDIDLSDYTYDNKSFVRKSSINKYSSKQIKSDDLYQLLINSFSSDEHKRRPYPSGGGLYSVDTLVFIFNERIENISDKPIISGCYHFLPISKKLQLIKSMSIEYFYKKLLHGIIADENYPAFCFLYVAHIAKSLFKYRYRGYRHAALETGAMYQNAIFNSQNLGLSNCVWGSFSENEMLCALDLDYSTYMPLIMQLFGYNKNV